ncbi:hypothetical protein WG899_17195 [Paucibacter sp. AS339]|uniref:hypothetical protein n=1 Tax=Paucibacter hankyongi TaxID=3133434 RepID=UPI003094A583
MILLPMNGSGTKDWLQKAKSTNPLTSKTSKDAALIEQENRPNSTRQSWNESSILLWNTDLPKQAQVFLVHIRAKRWQKPLPETSKSSTLQAALALPTRLGQHGPMNSPAKRPMRNQNRARRCSHLSGLLAPLALLLGLSACASINNPARENPQQRRERLANQYEMTAEGWHRLGSASQRDRYLRLAEQTRSAPPEESASPGAGGFIEALANAVFGTGPPSRK